MVEEQAGLEASLWDGGCAASDKLMTAWIQNEGGPR